MFMHTCCGVELHGVIPLIHRVDVDQALACYEVEEKVEMEDS